MSTMPAPRVMDSCYCNSEDWLSHEGTVGKAILGILHIVDDDGAELPVGEDRRSLL